jgi:threonine/homoserine/homoserine lactone efflux protein
MIAFRTYALFVLAALAIIAAPGPDVFYVLSRSVSRGKRIGSISAFGIASGEVLHKLGWDLAIPQGCSGALLARRASR